MQKLALIVALLITSSANAQIYKCVKDGNLSFQDTPCGRGSTVSLAIEDNATAGSALPWEGLSRGMSVAEVKRNVAGTSQVQGSHLSDGARELLIKRDVAFAGVPFEASYFFKDGKLAQVNVNDPELNKNEDTLRDFENLMSELRGRFGSEGKRAVKKESWGISGEAAWSVGLDKLWVSITPITADTSRLSFGYNFAR